MKITAIILLALTALLSACTTNKHIVLASTGTVIGLEIAQNPSTQMYQAKLGYDRAELALIPSNRASGATNDVTTGGGAADVADVVMELHYNNILSMSTSGIYQRLAVGKNAVNQPGAAMLFAKDKDGKLDPNVADAVSKAYGNVPAVNTSVTTLKVPLADSYRQKKTAEQAKFDAAAQVAGYANFDAFLIDPKTTAAQVEAVKKGLQ